MVQSLFLLLDLLVPLEPRYGRDPFLSFNICFGIKDKNVSGQIMEIALVG
jgi:hypothetical protein